MDRVFLPSETLGVLGAMLENGRRQQKGKRRDGWKAGAMDLLFIDRTKIRTFSAPE